MLNMILGGIALGFAASPTCPSNAEEIREGTRAGFRSALLVGLGAVFGDAAILILVLLGLTPLLQSHPSLNTISWLLGGLVLIYIAWTSLVEANRENDIPFSPPDNHVGSRRVSTLRPVWRGFAITAFNPFTGIWWVGLLGALTGSDSERICAFSLAVLAGALIWFVILAGVLHLSRGWLQGGVRRWTFRLSGLAVLGFGLYFIAQAGFQIMAS